MKSLAPLQRFHLHIQRGHAEHLLLRLGMALLLYFHFPFATRVTVQPVPNGLAHWLDLTFFSDPAVAPFIHAAFGAALCVYVLGRAMLPALTVMLFVVVGAGTLLNSQGSILHTWQIYGLVLVGQWLAYLLPWVYRAFGARLTLTPGLTLHDLAVHFTLEMIAAGYLIAAWMKLINSHGLWIWRLPNMATEVLKTNEQQYYNRLEPGLLEWAGQISSLIIAHPNLTRVVVGSALFIELFAFLALLGRRWAFAMGVALYCMHEGIRVIMNLNFTTNKMILLLFYINVPYLLIAAVRQLSGRGSDRARA